MKPLPKWIIQFSFALFSVILLGELVMATKHQASHRIDNPNLASINRELDQIGSDFRILSMDEKQITAEYRGVLLFGSRYTFRMDRK